MKQKTVWKPKEHFCREITPMVTITTPSGFHLTYVTYANSRSLTVLRVFHTSLRTSHHGEQEEEGLETRQAAICHHWVGMAPFFSISLPNWSSLMRPDTWFKIMISWITNALEPLRWKGKKWLTVIRWNETLNAIINKTNIIKCRAKNIWKQFDCYQYWILSVHPKLS